MRLRPELQGEVESPEHQPRDADDTCDPDRVFESARSLDQREHGQRDPQLLQGHLDLDRPADHRHHQGIGPGTVCDRLKVVPPLVPYSSR